MTWKGWVIEESLENRDILSGLRIVNSNIERNEEGGQTRIWRLDTVEVDDDKIAKVIKKLEKIMKFGFYAHFTDYKSMLIIFRGKHFKIKLKKVLKEHKFGAVEFKADPEGLSVWKAAYDYGTKTGRVDPRYIVKVV